MQIIQAATGFLVERHVDKTPTLLGSCFAYKHRHMLLTAAHCVKGLAPEKVGFAIPSGDDADDGLSVSEIIFHPKADIAALIVSGLAPMRILEFFWDYETAAGWGDEFIAFGYPADASLSKGVRPTPRMFRGFIQRFFEHHSHDGYEYVAAELSVGAPGGLSGGPVCWARDQSKVIGVVAANLESSTFTEKVEEIETPERITRYETRNMINYGLAVALYDISDWLEEVFDD